MVVAPDGDMSYLLSFAIGKGDDNKYAPFQQDDFAPFDITITYQDEHEESLKTEDGRPVLTRAVEVQYMKNQLPNWPAAVPQEMICETTEEAKLERARLILEDYFNSESYLKNIKFLDFGCGEGHLQQYGDRSDNGLPGNGSHHQHGRISGAACKQHSDERSRDLPDNPEHQRIADHHGDRHS